MILLFKTLKIKPKNMKDKLINTKRNLQTILNKLITFNQNLNSMPKAFIPLPTLQLKSETKTHIESKCSEMMLAKYPMGSEHIKQETIKHSKMQLLIRWSQDRNIHKLLIKDLKSINQAPAFFRIRIYKQSSKLSKRYKWQQIKATMKIKIKCKTYKEWLE